MNKLEGRSVATATTFLSYYLMSRLAAHYVSLTGSDLVIRPLMLKSADKLPLGRGIGSVVLDKAFDLLFVITLLIPAAFIMLQLASPSGLVAITIIALLVPWIVAFDNRLLPAVLRTGLRWARRVGSRIPLIGHRIPHQDQTEEVRFELLSRRTLTLILALTMLKYGALVLRLFFLVQALDLPISVTTIWAGIPIAQLSLLLAFTPGALGVLEGGWYAVLSVMSVNPDAISAFLIGQRLYWMAFSAVFALVGYVGLMIDRWASRNVRNV